jgi:signal transduction histidine kinase
MSFIEDVKSYLQRVRQMDVPQSDAPLITLDPSWVRSEVIRLFERLEHEASGPDSQELLEAKYSEWTKKDTAARFAAELATLLQQNFLRGTNLEELEGYVRLAIARRIGLKDRAPSKTRELELDRLSNDAWLITSYSIRDAWESIPDYASEIRAVRRIARAVELTPIGNVLLSLTGRDAVQWVLNVEMAQSTGPADRWRLSRETAAHLFSHSQKRQRPLYKFTDTYDFTGHSTSTLRRLGNLGLLSINFSRLEGDVFADVSLTETGLREFEALLSPSDTPFSVLAATLSQDEALAALEAGPSKARVEAGLGTSAMATARQARLVAHEIRNALIPAQVALGSLYDALVGSGVEAELGRYRPRIDPGINRVLKFVNDLLKTSELATRPPEAFSLFRALVDAKASITTSLDIAVNGSLDLPSVLGYRERFVLAVVNLLRNAEQVGAKNVELSVTLEKDGQNLLLLVDDDGPGVPAEHRERIFQRGVTLRKGGVGEGLALVKEVIEFELRGKIACVDKPGGGARFRMRLPVAERSLR